MRPCLSVVETCHRHHLDAQARPSCPNPGPAFQAQHHAAWSSHAQMVAAAGRVYWCAARVVCFSSVKFSHSLVSGAGKKDQPPAALRPARADMHARAPAGPSPGRGGGRGTGYVRAASAGPVAKAAQRANAKPQALTFFLAEFPPSYQEQEHKKHTSAPAARLAVSRRLAASSWFRGCVAGHLEEVQRKEAPAKCGVGGGNSTQERRR